MTKGNKLFHILIYNVQKNKVGGIIMNKNKVRNISVISVIVVVAIACGGFGIYKYSETQTYNNLIATANKDMDQGEYEQAIALFNQSLQYKDNDNVKNNIKLATYLKEGKSTFDEGAQLMNNKNYLEAIEEFKKVNSEDDKLYSNAQKKIEECENQYIAQNIQLTSIAVKNAKYDEANKYLGDILKLDTNNSEAKQLKDDVEKAIQKEKDEYTEEMAYKVAKDYECRVNPYVSTADFDNDGDIAAAFNGFEYHNGEKYGGIHLYSKSMVNNGGTGTIDNIVIAKDGTLYSSSLNGN
jgi:tetratricopeptide (TPR) repeat protein